MVFDGFSVDTIWGFRQHFSVKDLIEAIDNRFILANWFYHIHESGSLEEEQKELIVKIQGEFQALDTGEKCNEWPKIESLSLNNHEFVYRLLSWEKSVVSRQMEQYRHFCILFLYFLELGDYVISWASEEEEIVYHYLVKEGYIKTALLELKRIDYKTAGIYYKSTLVSEIKCEQESGQNETIVVKAKHPDTGYIGIDRKGKVINKSAFPISMIEGKAVKVVLNQSAYAILLDDGSLVHNLRFSDLPKAPVKDIELNGEQLMWKLME